VKNSLTDISRCCPAMLSAVARRPDGRFVALARGLAAGVFFAVVFLAVVSLAVVFLGAAFLGALFLDAVAFALRVAGAGGLVTLVAFFVADRVAVLRVALREEPAAAARGRLGSSNPKDGWGIRLPAFFLPLEEPEDRLSSSTISSSLPRTTGAPLPRRIRTAMPEASPPPKVDWSLSADTGTSTLFSRLCAGKIDVDLFPNQETP
jgi:hypothetical protein